MTSSLNPVQHDPATIPPDWRAGLGRLLAMPRPRPVVVPALWETVQRASAWLDTTGTLAAAHGLGWDALDIWGCHPEHPMQRYDLMGLAWCMSGATVSTINAGEALLVKNLNGNVLRVQRRSAEPQARQRRDPVVLAWDLPL